MREAPAGKLTPCECAYCKLKMLTGSQGGGAAEIVQIDSANSCDPEADFASKDRFFML